jgi:hypothetical protein
MKSIINITSGYDLLWKVIRSSLPVVLVCLFSPAIMAQEEESEETTTLPVDRPIRNTFESSWLIDNQTVIVPVKGTFQFDIQHRFGTIQNGFDDFFGFYAPSNIRMGFQYSPINNLSVGVGFTKANTLVDFNAKYALLTQTTGWSVPVSVTYFGNAVLDPRSEDDREVYHYSDRFSFFHQLLIARKFNDWLSVQIGPSLSHYNLQIDRTLRNDHLAIAFGAQVKISSVMSLLLNVDQPLTKHNDGNPSPNPNPNIALGVQISTSSHAFQFFLGNYNRLIPQENNMYFQGNYYDSFETFFDNFGERFRLGFNITRLWN